LEDRDSSEGDKREGIANQRDVNAYERASRGDQPSGQKRRSAEEFCHAGVEYRSSSRSSVDLVQQGAKLRVWAADLADHLADGAEQFASCLENSAMRGDQQRRLTMAAVEHEAARIAKKNASRLRDLNTTYERGERLPTLPGARPESKGRLAGRMPETD
jgi:hypothetical protein